VAAPIHLTHSQNQIKQINFSTPTIYMFHVVKGTNDVFKDVGNAMPRINWNKIMWSKTTSVANTSRENILFDWKHC